MLIGKISNSLHYLLESFIRNPNKCLQVKQQIQHKIMLILYALLSSICIVLPYLILFQFINVAIDLFFFVKSKCHFIVA